MVCLLLGRLQRLFIRQSRILQQQRERDQRHTQADADDAEDPLDTLIRMVDSVPVGRSHGVRDDPGIRRAVNFVCERRVTSNGRFDFLGQSLRPNRAGDAAAECRADIVGREVET